MKLGSDGAVSLICFFNSWKTSDSNEVVFIPNHSDKPSGFFKLNNTFITRCVVSTFNSIPLIVGICRKPNIFSAIIFWVSVNMVNYFVFWYPAKHSISDSSMKLRSLSIISNPFMVSGDISTPSIYPGVLINKIRVFLAYIKDSSSICTFFYGVVHG